MFSQNFKNRYYKLKNLWFQIRMWGVGLRDETVDENILTGKKVIIIGPAESSLHYMSGEEIDKYDIIIRMNNAPFSLKGKEHLIGSRTDILFHCCSEDPIVGGGVIIPEVLFQQKVKQVIYPMDEISLLSHYYRVRLKYSGLNISRLPGSYYWKLKQNYKGNIPTTGLQTLNYLLHSDCKELHITGFTFFTTPYIEGYKPEAYRSGEKAFELAISSATHDPKDELRLFREIYLKQMNTKKIFLDEELTRILQQIPPSSI